MNWKDETTIEIFPFYLIYFGAKKAFRKIMQHKEIWFVQ